MRFTLVPACLVSLTMVFPMSAYAAQPDDFVEFASEHCNAMIKNGRADLGFTLGSARGKFSPSELQDYSARFAQMLVQDYGVDPTKDCVLDTVSVGSEAKAEDKSHKPTMNRHYAPLTRNYNQAVVSGLMHGRDNVPVAVSYRMHQEIGQAWQIANISLNGQPIDDRYRERAEALADEGGSSAVLSDM